MYDIIVLAMVSNKSYCILNIQALLFIEGDVLRRSMTNKRISETRYTGM